MRRLQAERGGPLIWLKHDDMTGLILSGNRFENWVYCHKAKIGGFTALITCGGIQSNHCRATAFVAAQLRANAILFSVENLQIKPWLRVIYCLIASVAVR